MEINKIEGKRSMDDMIVEEEEEENDCFGDENMNTKRKRALLSSTSYVSSITSTTTGLGSCCQAEHCVSDMSNSKLYYRRHKVCEFHSKATVVLVAGLRKRFCQQCSRFHELSEFDEAKRSCRRRLAGHNERRRKISYDSFSQGERPS